MNFNKYKNVLKQNDIEFFSVKYRKNLKRLLLKKGKSLGRSRGSIVCWHKGGGVKRNFRPIFNYKQINSTYGIVRSIEYDPNRSAHIGLIQLETGAFCNIIVSSTCKLNQVISLKDALLDYNKAGDIIKLRNAPIGIPIFNLEKYPGSGPVYSKAAGVSAILLTKDLIYGKVKLSSGEERLFDLDCQLTLGTPSNSNNKFNKKYKAGTNRLLNKRPTVRGVAMNPVDHPHGGGEGKTKGGRPSVSPWGKLTKGVPTRKKWKKNKLIVK